MNLFSESELFDTWSCDEVKVTICCICFNHEAFLDDTFKGFFSQKFEYPFKVIVYDDLSTDNSREIILKWKNKYPRLIEVIFSKTNQYSRGVRPLNLLLPNVGTKYMALCEGDDYWCSEVKLQKQYDALELNCNSNVCFHPAYTKVNDDLADLNYGDQGEEVKNISVEKVIEISGGLMPMASLFIRTEALLGFRVLYPDFYQKLLRHSAIQIITSLKGGAIYIPDKMSIYRSMHVGSWTFKNSKNIDVKLDSFDEFIERNKKLNEITGFEYSRLFKNVLYVRSHNLFSRGDITFKYLYMLLRLVMQKPIGFKAKLYAVKGAFLGFLKYFVRQLKFFGA